MISGVPEYMNMCVSLLIGPGSAATWQAIEEKPNPSVPVQTKKKPPEYKQTNKKSNCGSFWAAYWRMQNNGCY
jgi:hypothetical protein